MQFDLYPMITLSRYFDKLLKSADKNYQLIYASRATAVSVDPRFLNAILVCASQSSSPL
jgi:hypothetical protein